MSDPYESTNRRHACQANAALQRYFMPVNEGGAHSSDYAWTGTTCSDSTGCIASSHRRPAGHWYRHPEEGTRVCGHSEA